MFRDYPPIGVHRQLLRKYASLEVENADFRKRIVGRDDRIKELEESARTRNGNMRSQADLHKSEVERMKAAYESQIETLKASNISEARRRASSKDNRVVKPIRGGGGGHGSPLDASPVEGVGGGGSGEVQWRGSSDVSRGAGKPIEKETAKDDGSLFSRIFWGR